MSCNFLMIGENETIPAFDPGDPRSACCKKIANRFSNICIQFGSEGKCAYPMLDMLSPQGMALIVAEHLEQRVFGVHIRLPRSLRSDDEGFNRELQAYCTNTCLSLENVVNELRVLDPLPGGTVGPRIAGMKFYVVCVKPNDVSVPPEDVFLVKITVSLWCPHY